jgi:hypothetical protein
MAKLINSCGIYLDWDNIWGGILDFLSIKYDPAHPAPLVSNQRRQIENFVNELPMKLHEALPDIRFIKAFADFDRLPYANSFSPSITSMLYNAEIEPHPSFVRAGKVKLKDASDRTLMLEVIEDIFFTDKTIDCVIIGSGDVDFYPLVTFIREHSDKKVSILTFRNGLSHFYYKISYLTKDGIHMFDDMMSHHKTLPLSEPHTAIEPKIVEPEALEGEQIYERFKNKLLTGIKNWTSNKGQHVRTGLVVNSWLPKWQLILTTEQVENYFERLKSEGIIEIIPINPQKPLQGVIKLKS